MKKSVFGAALLVLFVLAPQCQAQSLKDLFSKENVEKIIGSVTGTSVTGVKMEGTWTFTGSAVEFESDNLLQKAGGTVAASAAESKLDEQLQRFGITAGTLSFTFNADSTFQTKLGSKNLSGTYSYDASTDHVALKFAKLLNVKAKVTCTSSELDLLFNADKLMDVITMLASKSNNATLQSISALADNYDGMLLGFAMGKN